MLPHSGSVPVLPSRMLQGVRRHDLLPLCRATLLERFPLRGATLEGAMLKLISLLHMRLPQLPRIAPDPATDTLGLRLLKTSQ